MTTVEVVWSPVEDKHFNNNLDNSPVWKNCFHEEEVTDEVRNKYPKWFAYHIKFNGLKPVQLTKVLQK